MTRPVIFLSHIAEERDLAREIKDLIVSDLASEVDVFVSSDMLSIKAGDRWLEVIDTALKKADILLVLCSRESMRRPWIHFESGAGWVKSIPVIPLCHSGVKASQLPVPLSMLQAIDLSSTTACHELKSAISEALSLPVSSPQDASRSEQQLKEIQSSYRAMRLTRERNSLLRVVRSSLSIFLIPLLLMLIYAIALYAGDRDSAGSLLRLAGGLIAWPFGAWFRLSKHRIDWTACVLAAVLAATFSGAGTFLIYGLRHPDDLTWVLDQHGNIAGFYVSIMTSFFLGVALGSWLLQFDIGHRPWPARIFLRFFTLPELDRDQI